MGQVKLILCVMMLASLTLHAQQDNKQKKRGDQQLKEARQTANSNDQDADSVENPAANASGTADTPGAAEAAADANNNNDGNQGNDVSSERASNTPAVSQTTSSPSGSPAVLSDNDGKGRDGTNNVQRATMNMAGSPANNIRLNDKRAEDADKEMKDRQGYEQDKQRSAQNQSQQNTGNPADGNSGEINDNTRRENNDLSDQNLSSKEKRSAEKVEKRSDRKSRRKKDKG